QKGNTPNDAPRIADFFFQAEDGIRDYKVNGVQTCALPISTSSHLNDTKSLKNKYFHAIKQAKASHWKQFLATVDSRSIWTAKKLAVGKPPDRFPSIPDATTPLEINDVLLHHFFPPKDSPPSPSILGP